MGRVIFYKGFHHFLRYFLWLTLTLSGICGIIFTILALSLASGPIPLDFAIPFIEKQIQNKEETYELHVKHAQLIWDTENQKLVIQAKDILLKESENPYHMITIPDFELRYRLPSLLKAKIVPSEVAIIGPHIRIYQGAEGGFRFTKQPSDTKTSLSFLQILPRESSGSALKTLRHLILQDLIIDVENLATGEQWQIPKLNVLLTRHRSSIDLDLDFLIKGAKAQAKIKAELIRKERGISGMDIDMKADLQDFKFDELDKFWQEALAPKPRKWVIENLNGADVTKADLKMKWHLDFKDKNPIPHLRDIAGDIHFKGMDVQYLGTMPKVKNVDGVAHYNKESFSIDVLSGKQGDIQVKNGKIIIANMDKDDQNIDIELNLEGPVKAGLDILRYEPLKLDRKIKLNTKDISGQAKVNLHFDFPLDSDISPDQVNVVAKAEINDVAIQDVLGKSVPGTLKSKKLLLEINRHTLKVNGDSHFASFPLALKWEQKFAQHPQKDSTRYDIESNLTQAMLTQLGFDKYVEGDVSIKATIHENSPNEFNIKSEVDLTKGKLLLPLFNQPKVKAKKLLFEGTSKDGKIINIQNLSIQGEDVKASMKVMLNPKTGLISEAHISDAKIGHNQFSLKLKQDQKGEYHIDINGPVIDVKSILDYLRKNDSTGDYPYGIQLSFACDKALFAHDEAMTAFKLSCYIKPEGIEKLYINGQLASHKKNAEGYFTTALERQGDIKNLHISSNNAGLVFKMLDLTTTAKDGKFHINAQKKADEPWIGKFTVKHFYLTKAPIVTHILSLASPLGIIDAMTGQHITFSKFRTMFKYDGQQLTVKHGRAAGKSLGFTFRGELLPQQNLIDISGTIMPYNAFNMFLTKIPLVGTILGGKGGGIIGINYHLQGNQDQPHSSVNPLSVFTPGILRQIFSPAEDNDLEDTEDDDHEEE